MLGFGTSGLVRRIVQTYKLQKESGKKVILTKDELKERVIYAAIGVVGAAGVLFVLVT